MTTTRQQSKDAADTRRGQQQPPSPPRPQQQKRSNGSLLHLLNEDHVDPISRRRAPLSAPPAPPPFRGIQPPPVSPWNGIRAPLVPPTPPSQAQPSGSGRLAPPPSVSSWGGILTPTAFNAEYGGQDLGSSASRRGQECHPDQGQHGEVLFSVVSPRRIVISP
ncbi:hypothetical protein BT96DRAFT_1010513 [Gymnopus androsaceus JB14]|uniref:Uncharacterized protein n=1 Tax=Gymnopus androsaceus JB14 TaxID=1447944 RepID=A0A6A4GAS5_9AGAR|nr:hypothetical protein BT96DRAFT_1010513 [Gymnopus androsaceus JB14]